MDYFKSLLSFLLGIYNTKILDYQNGNIGNLLIQNGDVILNTIIDFAMSRNILVLLKPMGGILFAYIFNLITNAIK